MTKRLRFRVIDCETTGIPTETEKHALVELGWTDVILPEADAGGLAVPIVLEPHAHLVNPGRDIPAEASAVHGIRNSDVAGAPTPDKIMPLAMVPRPDYFVAHHKEFDQTFFGGGDVPWICSHKVALRVWNDAPIHSAHGLRHWLNIDDDGLFDRDLGQPYHRGGPDSYTGAWVFARELAATTIENMVRWSSGPALLITCYMKMHKGERWVDVARADPSYLTWIVDKSDITDRDIRATARYYLKNPPPPLQPAASPPQKEATNGDTQTTA